MYILHKRFGKKAIELFGFHKVRKYTDGVTFFHCEINLDLFKGDHNPKFTIQLILMNFTIFEFNWYDTRHTEEMNVGA